MRARVAAGAATAAALVVAGAVAVALALAVTLAGGGLGHRMGGWTGGGAGPMMSAPSSAARDGTGPTTIGSMHGAAVSSEYDYLSRMVSHHQEAVSAARQLQRSDRAAMRAFGESIVVTQSAQIRQMERWLAAWYPDRPTHQADYRPMMRDLRGLSGARLDRAFLQDMTVHHMAAVMMSQQLLVRDLADHPQVAALARSIRHDQRAEIVQMHRWQRQWFGLGPQMWRGGTDGRRGSDLSMGMGGYAGSRMMP